MTKKQRSSRRQTNRKTTRRTGSSRKNTNAEGEDNRNDNSTGHEQHHPLLVDHYTSFKRSLDDCSLELIEDAYRQHRYRQQGDIFKKYFDPAQGASREKMEDFLLKTTLLDFPLSKSYVRAAARELKEMGGMKMTTVISKGKKNTESFIHTKGFTDLGGPEFLMQNVHRSIFPWISRMLNEMYKNRKNGTIYRGNAFIYLGKVVYKLQKPSESDALVLKATKMFDTLSYYGLNGYDVLYLIPFAVQIDKGMSMDELHTGSILVELTEEDVPGFARLDSRELRMCELCTTTDQELEGNGLLKKCGECKTALYCSQSCQKKHWKTHKSQCADLQEFQRKNSQWKKKDQQEKDHEDIERMSSFFKKFSMDLDWDEYSPEKKERMKSEEGRKEYIRDAMNTAHEVNKFRRSLKLKQSQAASM
jgi:hypothetical protein